MGPFTEILSGDRSIPPAPGEPGSVVHSNEGFDEATAVLALPRKYRRRLRTTKMLKRLIGALRSEYHDEWSRGQQYLNMQKYFEWKRAAEKATEEMKCLNYLAGGAYGLHCRQRLDSPFSDTFMLSSQWASVIFMCSRRIRRNTR